MHERKGTRRKGCTGEKAQEGKWRYRRRGRPRRKDARGVEDQKGSKEERAHRANGAKGKGQKCT